MEIASIPEKGVLFMNDLVAAEIVEERIHIIRGQKVMLSIDLAPLYEVQVKVIIQAVKRNIERFPSDFMFKLSKNECEKLSRSQFVTLKRGENIKYRPYAFTEQGIAMLSSVLRSKRAIEVNIQIMCRFRSIRPVNPVIPATSFPEPTPTFKA